MVVLSPTEKKAKSWWLACLLLLLPLGACGGNNPPESAARPGPQSTAPSEVPKENLIVQGDPIKTPPSQSSTPPEGSKLTLDAGAYCYRTEEDSFQAIAEFLVEPSQDVSGTLEATITDAAAGYYTSYTQNMAGTLSEETLNASVTTEIENDVQQSQESWTLNRQQFSDGRNITLKRVSCEEIIALKANRDKTP
jgi:hypothetical protein